jgi:hypothetical protein
VRDRDTIDAELRIVAAVRRTVSDAGGPPPSAAVLDQLLDERLASHGTPSAADPNT